MLLNVWATEDPEYPWGPVTVYLTFPVQEAPSSVALTLSAVVASVSKLRVKVIVPPSDRLWVETGVISEKVAPAGPPEL